MEELTYANIQGNSLVYLLIVACVIIFYLYYAIGSMKYFIIKYKLPYKYIKPFWLVIIFLSVLRVNLLPATFIFMFFDCIYSKKIDTCSSRRLMMSFFVGIPINALIMFINAIT